jgi:hypothetical protein
MTGTNQTISTANSAITAGHTGVIGINISQNFSASAIFAAETAILSAVNASTATTGDYAFVLNCTQGAAIYEAHFTGSNIDGIQLIGVVNGATAATVMAHMA